MDYIFICDYYKYNRNKKSNIIIYKQNYYYLSY